MKPALKLTGLLLTCGAATAVSGCFPLVMGGAAAVGYSASQERGLSQTVKDSALKVKVKDSLARVKLSSIGEITALVYNGNVLLTGVVQEKSARDAYGEAASSVSGVSTVYNEILYNIDYDKDSFAEDVKIANMVRGNIIGSFEVNPTNVTVSVFNKIAYIMGVVPTEKDRQAILHKAATTKGVDQVVDYIIVEKAQHKGATVSPSDTHHEVL